MNKWSGKTAQNIREIEINCANICGASCLMCSREHGRGNVPFMQPDVFTELVSQLKDVTGIESYQTSGNGESFLNPHYLDYVSTLQKEFPNIPTWTYNNFSMWDKEKSDRIIAERLFDKIHVRIDSLQRWIFEKNSNLNQTVVFDNLKYFLSKNTEIPVVILYNNIIDYYDKCFKILNKRPTRDFFTDLDLSQIQDEEQKILDYFQEFSKTDLNIFRIGHSLWGERRQAIKDVETPCPKYDIIKDITWICPNGEISVCMYDDTQDAFIAGNIMETHILDIFYGETRTKILENIKNRYYIEYPCTSPKCCGFNEERDMKK